MDIVKVTFNDNTVHEYKKGTLFYDASKDFDMENIVGYKINNEVFSLDNKLLEDVKVDFINTNDLIGNRIYKAGLKFLFLVSLQEVFNDFDVVYEHSVPRGMLGVLKGPRVLSHEDISKIKARMCKLISDNEIITKLNVSAKDAIKYFNDKKEIFIEGVKNYSDNIMFPMLDVLKRKDKKFDNLEETLDEILDIFIKKHTLTKKAHEEMIALSHQDEDIAEIFHSKEITMTKQIVEVLKDNGFECDNFLEKVHIIIGIVENYCHEIVYHKHSSLNYEMMKKEVITIITIMLNNYKS